MIILLLNWLIDLIVCDELESVCAFDLDQTNLDELTDNCFQIILNSLLIPNNIGRINCHSFAQVGLIRFAIVPGLIKLAELWSNHEEVKKPIDVSKQNEEVKVIIFLVLNKIVI